MPLDIQQGEVADRLRKFFRLSGRIPATLDETVVPVAILQSLDQPPWRLTAQRGAAYIIKTLVAAEQLAIAVQHPLAVSGRTVVDKVFVSNEEATTGFYSIGYGSMDYVTGIENVVTIPNVEQPGPPPGGAPTTKLAKLPINTATFHGGNQNVSRNVGHLTCPATDTRVLDGLWVLSPGWQLMVWNELAGIPTRTGFHLTYYPDAG